MGKSVTLIEGSVSVVIQAVVGLVIVFAANFFGEVSPPYSYGIVIGALVGINILQLMIQSTVGAAPANMIGWGLIIVLASMDSMNPGMLRSTPDADSPPVTTSAPKEAKPAAAGKAAAGNSPNETWSALPTDQKIKMLEGAKSGWTFAIGTHVPKGLVNGDKNVTVAAVNAMLPMTFKELDPVINGYRMAAKDSDAKVKAAAEELRKTKLGPNMATLMQTVRALAFVPEAKGGSSDNIGSWCAADKTVTSCTLTGDNLDEVVVMLADAAGKDAFMKRKADLKLVRAKKIRLEHDGKTEVVELKSLADDDISAW